MAQICTKLFSDWGFAPDTTEGAHSAPPNPLAGKGEGKRGEGKGRGRKGTGIGREGKRGEVIIIIIVYYARKGSSSNKRQ